jgi:malonyl-CoA/methylmalonyl-CoA synthetase
MLSQNNLLSNAVAIADSWHITRHDTLLHLMPFYHTHGLLISTNAMLVRGAAMLLLDRPDRDTILQNLDRVTMVTAPPGYYSELAATDDLTRDMVSSVRLFVSGGAPLDGHTLDQFRLRSGQSILERHGMSELGVSVSNPYLGLRKAGTVGLPLPGISVRICDLVTGEVVASGAVGEVEVCGPNVFNGYWGDRGLTMAAFHDSWFRTGDVGRFDADGYLEILGRLDDIVMCDGQLVESRRIEQAIAACPDVAECACVSVPHQRLGEVVLGIVVPRAGRSVTSSEILQSIADRIGADAHRLRIVSADNLPKTSTGKLQKRLLRERYRGMFGHGPDAPSCH